jgi:osmotically-inducible protein OsmY
MGARQDDLIQEIENTLQREMEVDLGTRSLHIDCSDGTAVISGEVRNVAEKGRIAYLASTVHGVDRVEDGLRVVPGKPMEDSELASHLAEVIERDPSFVNYTLKKRVAGEESTVRQGLPEPAGTIELEVEDGEIVLSGEVEDPAYKRLAGALAWWAPGTRNVVNNLELRPGSEDNDDEILEGLRIVMDMNPFLDSSQIAIQCANGEVILDGLVANPEQREMAEMDAWCTFGVRHVDNRIQVEGRS